MKKLYTVALALFAINLLSPINLSAQDNQEDTLVRFKSAFDKNSLEVVTARDSDTRKDSTIYANLQSKPNFYINFESGRVKEIKYCATDTLLYSYEITTDRDPLNPIDTLVAPSSRWFYFLMTGAKGKEIAIQLKGTDARAAVYSYDNHTWQRYDPKSEAFKRNRITKRYERDSVYIAYYVPYTNRHLQEKMESWQYNPDVRIYSIGKSQQGREMQMLTITNAFVSDKNKKRIYIHGRVHPSETPCSWALEGLIDHLIENTPYAKALRENAVFYILPFTNPDGVAGGLSRSDSYGVNMEINYNREDSLTRPEVKNIKKFLTTTTYNNNHIDLFLNFHSQIAPHFTYWIHNSESTSERYYKELLTFAALTIDGNPYANRECLSFSSVAPRYIEGWFWDNAKEATLAITHETPYSYYNKDEEDIWVTIDNLKEIGKKTLQTIGDYLKIDNPDRVILFSPTSSKKMSKQEDFEHIYLGDYYLSASEDKAQVKYKIKNLQKGEYEVYKWIVGERKRVSNEGENLWQKIGEHTQKKDGDFTYSIKDIAQGENINGLLLIKK